MGSSASLSTPILQNYETVSKPLMEQAVIYTRVSSERQVIEGGGIRSQEQRCRSFAGSCGYQVVGSFSDEGISGAVTDRPGIQALLSFLQAQYRETVVIIDDISRIARDVIAHMKLRASIKAAGGRLESPSFTFGDSASDELLETIMAATAQYGRKGNREQVLNRQKARLQLGYWTFPAPPGYQFEKHPLHKKIIVPSPVATSVLGPALESFSIGRIQTNRELALFLKAQGFFADQQPVNITILEKRITRIMDVVPLYGGFVEYLPWKVDRVAGQHEAIISRATLSRLEERLNRRIHPFAVVRADSDPQLMLRNFVRCAGCGRPLTGHFAKGKYPRYFCYYQAGCDRYGHSIKARVIEPAFEQLLADLAPTDEFMDVVASETRKLWKGQEHNWDTERQGLERQITQLQQDTSGLVRRLAKSSDEVAEEIEKELTHMKAQVTALEGQHARYSENAPNFVEALQRVSTFFRNPADYWKNGSDKQKRTVHRMVFTVPPVYDLKSGFSTYDLTLPYLISSTFKGSKDRMVDLPGETQHLNIPWTSFMEQILEWAQWFPDLDALPDIWNR
jgi:site-specific DNA recombinase